jgi:hypothetical protein
MEEREKMKEHNLTNEINVWQALVAGNGISIDKYSKDTVLSFLCYSQIQIILVLSNSSRWKISWAEY